MNTMRWIFAAQCAGLVVYEFVALFQGRGDTISEITWELISKWPLIAFAWGMLMGHFVWQQTYKALGLMK